MEPFVIRLLIAALVIFLIEKVLALLKLREPAQTLLFAITLIVMLLFALFGGYVFPLKT